MKRATLIITLMLLVCAAGAFAQEFENESEYYPKTLQIHRIYTHSLGYRVDYVKQDYSLGSFWAPIEWFRGAASKGGIAFGEGRAYPYVSFFYKNGELDHFRLYLIEDVAHASWGNLDPTVDYSGEFPSVDATLELEF